MVETAPSLTDSCKTASSAHEELAANISTADIARAFVQASNGRARHFGIEQINAVINMPNTFLQLRKLPEKSQRNSNHVP